MMPCSLVEVFRRFGGTYCLQLQGQTKHQYYRLVLACYIVGLLFESEVGGTTFLRNVDRFLPEYTAFHPRRQYPYHRLEKLKSNVDEMRFV
jgi:hypothetical protein